MPTRIGIPIALALLLASCGGSVATSPTPPVATATSATTTPRSTAAITASATPQLGVSSCTGATLTTRQVIERYFALSVSNDAAAVTDCWARFARDKNQNFAESAAIWSHDGPATNVVVTPVDVVNGCDRFRVTAQMPSSSFWMKGQTGGQGFFSVGPDSGLVRIYEIATAMGNANSTSLRCG